MNHKRKRPKQARAGCLMCKPNKLGKGMEKELGHRGFGNLRREAAAQSDYRLEHDHASCSGSNLPRQLVLRTWREARGCEVKMRSNPRVESDALAHLTRTR